MDADNHLLLEKYFSTHNSPYEKVSKTSKHVKFASPQTFQTDLLKIYSESGTSNLPSIYRLVHETFRDVEMSLSHSDKYSHIYCAAV